jgi:hypothetical protein
LKLKIGNFILLIYYDMRLSILAIFILAIFPLFSYGQEVEEVPFKYETGIGINWNTNGGLVGGLFAKRSVYIRKNMYHYFALELVNVKHPKELRYANPTTGNSFIFYKENYLFSIRPMYGREFLLFRKGEEEGVRVSGLVAGGLTLGWIKPYAIQYDYTDYSGGSGPPIDVRNEPYDPSIHTDPQNRILGTGGLLTGIGKSKFSAGISTKAGLIFEIGPSNTGIEVGGLLEVFPKKIPIMANSPNYNVFTSLYVNIYYGFRN